MKRWFSGIIVLCAFISLAGTAAFGAGKSGPQFADQLSLKERWMRVPAELDLTPSQTDQFKHYASQLHESIRASHDAMIAKLNKILSPEQMKGLREWGEAYRAKWAGQERTVASEDEMHKSLDNATKELQFTAKQDAEFKQVTQGYHMKKHQLFENFCAHLNKVLSPSQRAKFADMKDEL